MRSLWDSSGHFWVYFFALDVEGEILYESKSRARNELNLFERNSFKVNAEHYFPKNQAKKNEILSKRTTVRETWFSNALCIQP